MASAANAYVGGSTIIGTRNNSVCAVDAIMPASARPKTSPIGIAAKINTASSPSKM